MAGLFSFKEVDDVREKYIETEGFARFMQILHELNGSTAEDSDLVKRTRGLLAKALVKARQEGLTNIAPQLGLNQRHAEKALRANQFSKRSGHVGGYLSILKPARNGISSPRPIPNTKSGKPREWSDRTKQVYGYQGEDAQFILYWLTVGTAERMAGLGRSNRRGEYKKTNVSSARRKYFGNSHSVGKIDKDKINPRLVEILERVVNGEFIPGIDEIVKDIYNKK